MNDIISQIEKIKKINKQHKLVIFVGAGVSRNSGICSWSELVKDMAIKIKYNNCARCKMKHLICAECGGDLELCSYDNYNCDYKYNFSNDDFLKIPQYFYDTMGQTAYEDLLKDKFCKPYIPNAIDDLIIKLNPEHIITTNYDHLLEDVKHPNRSKYTEIKSDKDILEKYGRHYIIKMHGDIDEMDKMVLREDDYLKYSQNHILIETYIKSLLIDKTFLFVGYSLNDNNLSLIMSYIDYFVKDKNVEKRSPHYLVVNEELEKNRYVEYWNNKGIDLVDLSQINDIMKNNSTCDSLKYEQGKLLYTFLYYIKNDKLPYSNDKVVALKKSLLNRFEQSEPFKFISYTNLIEECDFSRTTQIINSSLSFYDKNEYNLLKMILEQNDNDSIKIKKTFTRAGICAIRCRYGGYYKFDDSCFEDDKLFDLALLNKYSEIIDILKEYPDDSEKAYYYSLIYHTKENKCQDVLSKIEAEIKSLDYKDLSNENKYKIAVFEYNVIAYRQLRFQPNDKERWDMLIGFLDYASNQSKAFEYIKKLIEGSGEIINKLNDKLVSHEEYYMKKSTMTKLGGTVYGDLFDLQCIVYDYYLFYKKNHLMLDWFNNVKKIAEPYIKAILCTYYPDEYQYSANMPFGRTQVKSYPLTLIDIDIWVKHMEYKKLLSWIISYKVRSITVGDYFDIVSVFNDFCISIKKFWHIGLLGQLESFSLLLSLIDFDEEQQKSILKSYINVMMPITPNNKRTIANNLEAVWIYVQKQYSSNIEEYTELLKLLIDKDIFLYATLNKSCYQSLIDKMSDCADEIIYKQCLDVINADTGNMTEEAKIFTYRNILFGFNENSFVGWIMNNIDSIQYRHMYYYLYENKIKYSELILDYYIKKLQITYDDDLINLIIILYLIGKIDNIEFLKEYANNSDYLEFIFFPNNFDYSKVTTSDYMWCNILNNKDYRKQLLLHKSDFWTKDDEQRISLGFGSNFENRVVYKYLFD